MKRVYGSMIALAMVLAIAGSSGVAFSGEKVVGGKYRVSTIKGGAWDLPGSLAIDKIDKEKSDPLMARLHPEDMYGP